MLGIELRRCLVGSYRSGTLLFCIIDVHELHLGWSQFFCCPHASNSIGPFSRGQAQGPAAFWLKVVLLMLHSLQVLLYILLLVRLAQGI